MACDQLMHHEQADAEATALGAYIARPVEGLKQPCLRIGWNPNALMSFS